jgi:adenosylcobyric acid synthase
MLGVKITDPCKVETSLNLIAGLGLLPIVTEFKTDKTTTRSEGVDQLFQTTVYGYEIHMGETKSVGDLQPLVGLRRCNGRSVSLTDGAVSPDQRVFGTYLHGIFDNSQFTRAFLNQLRAQKGLPPVAGGPVDYWRYKETQYDQLAQVIREHLDLAKIYAILEAGA